jgi:RND superfamily putative drug exporter
MRGRWLPWAVLAAWLVLAGISAPAGQKIREEVNDEYELPAGSQSAEIERILRERFPGGDQRTTLLVYSRPGGLSAADRMRILGDAEEAARIEHVARPVPPFTPQSPDGLVSADGSVAFTIVPLVAGEVFHVRGTIEELRALDNTSDGLTLNVTGFPALVSDGNTIIQEADAKLLAMTALLVLVLLLAVYRSPLLALVPLFVVGVAYMVASGIIYLLHDQFGLAIDNTSTSLLLVLMFGAGTDYCLLMVSRYRPVLLEQDDAREAALVATRDAAPAIVASGLTVITALLVMLAGVFGVVRTLGPVNAIGIAVVMVASLTLLPAVLALLGRRVFWPRTAAVAHGAPADDPTLGIWHRIGVVVRRRPAAWLAASVGLLLVCTLGLFVYSIDLNNTRFFRAEADSATGYELLARSFPPGTVNPTTVLVERSDGTIQGGDLAAVAQRLESVGGIAAVQDSGRRSTDARVAEMLAVFSDDPLERPAIDRIATMREAVAGIDPSLDVLVGGGSGERYDYRAAGARDLRVVAPLVLLVVLLTLVVLLRAIVAPLYLLGTVILSFLAAFGVTMVFVDVVLDRPGIDASLPLIIFIFLVALGSDYNIFLMSRVRELAGELGTKDAMLRALGETGPVITSAGLILAGTFGVLLVLPQYQLMAIGFAVAFGVLLDTFVVRSICVPAIVWLVGDRSWWPSRLGPEPEPEAPVARPGAMEAG